MIRGVRGATTVVKNTENEIIGKTEELLRTMIVANQINATDVAQVLISVTADITACFPAKALRKFDGWEYVPVMCTKEIAVPNSLPSCIRVMMTVNTETQQKDVQHIYLHKAVTLRPDLVKSFSVDN
ncbi:chorismate mutase [Sutcliffiella rhizosphaerae]|uniref:chorismate mutase n=1 Tax=Sutcliffiella rhizosphaerae TaxID=2880967 RepID=A0ABM8YRP1_9BACI|nr:chorismate mutase [Sutcliffiella rhizosphaerae]CAG9622654.1 Chorismate mutase AroH [Sutcliffiella rhizosphaerae]